ncbi:MAG: TonB-dependent receptor, partial [Rhodospirillales bacterium]|nr:TonB-dependent receptor [Rhodospirillales bacterium]
MLRIFYFYPWARRPVPRLDAGGQRCRVHGLHLGSSLRANPDIALRASGGTGFLPPSLAQIIGEPPSVFNDFLIFLLDIRDPMRGNDLIPGPLTLLSGGSPDLQPEQSESSSFGVVLTPRFAPGLRVSVDVTHIHKTDEVVTLPLDFFTDNEADFPGRITRGPNLPGDPPGTPGPITQIDFSSLNLASSGFEGDRYSGRVHAADRELSAVGVSTLW